MITIHTGWRGAFMKANVDGGPFDNFKKYRASAEGPVFGFCVRAERAHGFDGCLAIQDFTTPDRTLSKDEVDEQLKKALRAVMQGSTLYIGCAGGLGRTGLVMALVVKVLKPEVQNPVEFVRIYYNPHAVETLEQEKYVEAFDVRGLRSWWIRESWKARMNPESLWWAATERLKRLK